MTTRYVLACAAFSVGVMGNVFAAAERTMTISGYEKSGDLISAVNLAFTPGEARTLCLAFGERDYGESYADWPQVVKTAEIVADQTSCSVPVPEGWGMRHASLRFFLLDGEPTPYAKRLKSLAATGKQYVITDFTPTGKAKVETKVRWTSTSGNANVFCARLNTTSKDYFTLFRLGGQWRWDYHATQTMFGAADTTTDYEISASADGLTLNGTTTAALAAAEDFTASYPMTIFASYEGGPTLGLGNFASAHMYSFKAWADKDDAASLRLDLVPCQTADGVVCFYDRVSGGKLFNSGTEPLTAGEEGGPLSTVVAFTEAVGTEIVSGGGVCTANGYTSGGFAVSGQLETLSPVGTTSVSVRWGYAENALENESAATTIAATANPPTYRVAVNGPAANSLVYWSVRTKTVRGGKAYFSDSPVGTVRTAFLPTTLKEPVYEIDIASGTTDLVDWMTANSIDSISGTGTIVKKGKGTLTVTTAALSAFTGDVYILAGGRITTYVDNPLGTVDGKVYVEYGASLYCSTKSTTTTGNAFGSKPVYAEGTGTDGNGGILGRTGNGQCYTCAIPKSITMTGDLRIQQYTHTQISSTIDMQGHTLTMSGDSTWDIISWTLRNPGHLILPNQILFSSAKFEGDESHTVTVLNGGYMRANSWTSTKNWTLIMKEGSCLHAGQNTSYWHGPVILDGRCKFGRQFDNTSWTLYGKVTGVGGLGTANNANQVIISLKNAANDFKGGVYLKGNVLRLDGNGTLPKDGAALTNFNGTVFFDKAGAYDLPEAYFSGTGMVKCTSGTATGSWKNRVVKDGAGELVYQAQVGSPRLELRQGSVYFPIADTAQLPVFESVQVRPNGGVRFAEGFAGPWSVGKLVSGGGTIGYDVATDGFVVETATAGEKLTVAGALVFAEGATVEVPADLAHGTYDLATADSINRCPKSANEKWYTQLSADGKTVQLVWGVGLKVFIR